MVLISVVIWLLIFVLFVVCLIIYLSVVLFCCVCLFLMCYGRLLVIGVVVRVSIGFGMGLVCISVCSIVLDICCS